MAVQQTQVSLGKLLGKELTEAHKKHKDAAVDRGNMRLPGGIKNGIAQLNSAYISTYKDGDHKGKPFFRASGIVKVPKEVAGVSVEGLPTQVMIPLFNVPAKGNSKAKPFVDNWFDFQNWFKQFNVLPPEEDDPFKIEAYYVAAAQMLCDDKNGHQKPHFSFSTRSWTPPKKAGQKEDPTPMVFEEWHGVTELNEHFDPAAGVSDGASNGELMPSPGADAVDVDQPPQSPSGGDVANGTEEPPDLDLLASIADNDPTGDTEEGKSAIDALTALAIGAGATQQQVNDSDNWVLVAEMAKGGGKEAPNEPAAPVLGTVVMHQPRNADGTPKRGKDKKPVAASEHEVCSVDPAAKVVTLKNVKTKQFIFVVKPDGSKMVAQVPWDQLA